MGFIPEPNLKTLNRSGSETSKLATSGSQEDAANGSIETYYRQYSSALRIVEYRREIGSQGMAAGSVRRKLTYTI